jgi:hypothetical protein
VVGRLLSPAGEIVRRITAEAEPAIDRVAGLRAKASSQARSAMGEARTLAAIRPGDRFCLVGVSP